MSDYLKKFSLEGKLAWVTGASYGIGYAIALCYARAGAKIAFNCRHQDGLDKALANYKADGVKDVRGYICDVTDENQVKETLINSSPKIDAYEDFAYWDEMLIKAFGERKFIKMDKEDSDIYGKQDD